MTGAGSGISRVLIMNFMKIHRAYLAENLDDLPGSSFSERLYKWARGAQNKAPNNRLG